MTNFPRARSALLVLLMLCASVSFVPSSPARADRAADKVAIRSAILAEIATRDDVLAFIIHNVTVRQIGMSSDNATAIATLGFFDRNGGTVPSEPGLAIARRTVGGWAVTLQSDPEWNAVLAQVPDNLLSPSARESWSRPTGLSAFALGAPGGFRLPWPAGQTKYLTQSVAHTSGSGGPYAWDFADGTMFPLAATRGGRVKFAVWTYPDNFSDGNCNHANYLVIEDTSTTPTSEHLYLHMAGSTLPPALRVPGAVVKQGQYIGMADSTGCSTGHHLHFQVHTNTSSWWGSSVDIQFSDVAINGGRPRLPQEAAFYGGTGQDAYLSGNSTPDACGTTTPATTQAILYTGPNYTGDCAILAIADYGDFRRFGLPADSVSSVRLGSGVTVSLHRDMNFAGASSRFTGSDDIVANNNIGDNTTSSVIVARKTVTNRAPVAQAGPDQTLRAPTASLLIAVSLDASASTDLDGEPLTAEWFVAGNLVASGLNATVSLPVGTHPVTLTVKDPGGASASDTLTVTILPPPTITLSATTGSPNSRLAISLSGFDPGNATLTLGPYSLAMVAVAESGIGSVTLRVPTRPQGTYDIVATNGIQTASASFTIRPVVTASPSLTSMGATITVTVRGFAAYESVRIRIENDDSSYTTLATVTTSVNGRASQTVTLPATAGPGKHVLRADGTANRVRTIITIASG